MTIAHTVGHITLNDIRRLLIPNVPRKTHDSITAKVQSMHTARARARELLDRAKLAVEIAIEKDEKAALESLRE